MKRMFFLICLFPLSVLALDRAKLDAMLATAAQSADGKDYIEARQAILDLGTVGLPVLAQAATDAALTWQQRLAARICHERIARGNEVEALRRYDWAAHPQYNKDWERYIIGPAYKMGEIVVPKLTEAGLWYYYIELNWKQTREHSFVFRPSSSLKDAWESWSIMALKDQPECHYLIKALVERLESDPALSGSLNVNYYKCLLAKKESDAVPVLLSRLSTFVKSTRPSTLSAEEFDKATGWELGRDIMPFADSRHADLIEKFISEHPALAPLKEKIAEIRARPAPAPRAEPAFPFDLQSVKP